MGRQSLAGIGFAMLAARGLGAGMAIAMPTPPIAIPSPPIAASPEPVTPAALLDGALARVGDRLPLELGHAPTAILVYAAWSPPSLLERDIFTEIAGPRGPDHQLGSRVNLLFLDADDPAARGRLEAIGGVPVVPYALLVDAHGIVYQRYLGWPGRNPSEIREIVIRDLAALIHR